MFAFPKPESGNDLRIQAGLKETDREGLWYVACEELGQPDFWVITEFFLGLSKPGPA